MAYQSKVPVFVTLSVAVFVLAACGAKPRVVKPLAAASSVRVSSPPAPPARVVHVESSAGVTTIRERGGRWTAPDAVATPDWSTIFTVEANRLRTLNGVTGTERASQPVSPGLRPVVSAADGHYVALTDSPVRVGQGVLPAGRSHSTVVVAAADSAAGQPRTVNLDGNIVPEGFSSDDSRLFVIEFLPAMRPDRYRVRSLDLASGQIGPVYTFDKAIDTEVMQGLSRTQVLSAAGPFGSMLYTLYSRAGGAAGYADLHALSLEGGFVHCTDFPPSLHIGPSGGAIAVSPDGRRVYVASEEGTVAEIDTSNSSQQLFPIVYTAQLVPGPGVTAVALTADNHSVWVAVGTRVVRLDATDLHKVSTTTVSQPVYALAITQPDMLYAATSRTVEVIDPANGATSSVIGIDTAPTRLAVT